MQVQQLWKTCAAWACGRHHTTILTADSLANVDYTMRQSGALIQHKKPLHMLHQPVSLMFLYRLWNANSGAILKRTDTGSQVCGLAWSTSVNELISVQGYAVNSVCLWAAPSLSKITTLNGHSGRVLYLAMSPCGTTAATGAGETHLMHDLAGSRTQL